MKKIINGTQIGAYTFVAAKKFELSKEEIQIFVEKVREQFKDKKNIFIGPFDITILIEQYPFIFENTEDWKSIRVNEDLRGHGVLNAYVGANLPTSIKRQIKKTTEELYNQEEKEEPKIHRKKR